MAKLVNSKIYVQTKYEKTTKEKDGMPEKNLNIYAKEKRTELHWYIIFYW